MAITPKVKPSKFRSPHNNTRLTKQLFYDQWKDMTIAQKEDAIDPIYSLHEDIDGLINFGKHYVNDMDTTGYKTSQALLESYEHWNMLMRAKWFREAKEIWDKEIAAKMEKEAIDKLRNIMSDPEAGKAQQMGAAKALLGKAKTIANGDKRKPGRPSKEEIKGALKEEMRLSREEQEDLDRIRRIK